ncbi:hypothetical protein B0T16DRAFT_412238 [Cercophora newfieldiana]|uniref:WHIM1 domain-containing protein n=1 Tax=Cercophora newfieldiana TaxID=92897 RepID=A0AA39Y4S6_9PEZI|nr:hypothetical protein B0T16DRAFT_412238 [Cercophora newfieldiana]
MADDDSSELSSISSLSAPPSDDESDIQLQEQHGILKFFHKVDKNPALEPKEATPPKVKREPSPPHEYVLADNPDIAFIVMFRARFTEAFPKSLPNFGPQELERDIVDTIPGERVEQFLCALLSLLLNRKQDVKPGHYNRALEEAIQSHKGQWAKDWESQNPLSGSANFGTMTPVQRLTLLRTLVQWTLASSDAVKSMINAQYKNRHDEDLNIPLSVQPWGSDGEKRRYFLIEGNDDTAFRVYRESNPAGTQRTWWSIAGTIDELKALGEKLETHYNGPKAKALAKRITASIPRFEATEEKRRRREYRQMRKEQFKRPEVGMSLYEGRTRGKRMKYTYSEDEEDFYSDSTNRRSTRNTRNHTPAEPSGPVTTASGRQIRAPTRLNADNASNEAPSANASVQGDGDSQHGDSVGPTGRPRRSAAVNHSMSGWGTKKRKSQEYDSDDEDDGSEPDFGDDEDEHVPDEEDEEEDEFDEDVLMDDDLDDDLEDAMNERFMFTFPIRVAIDEDNKARKIPGPPILAAINKQPKLTKHPRAAHRNVVISDESDEKDESESNRGDSTDVADETAELVREPEGPAAEVIAVATKQVVSPPDEPIPAVKGLDAPIGTPSKPPLTPSSGTPTSLAFRGSPEKPQHVSVQVDSGY